MSKIGKKGKLTQAANKLLNNKFTKMGVTSCEICGSTFGLTWAHRKNRRYYNTLEELADIKEVMLVCLACHQRYLEYDKRTREEWFLKKRGN